MARNRSQSTDFDVDTDMAWDTENQGEMGETSRRGRKGGQTRQDQQDIEDTGAGAGEEGIGGTPQSGTTIDDDF